MKDVIVIGGGIAGLTAVIYAARRGMKTCVVTPEIGGRTNLAHQVENYPGFAKITGPDLMKEVEKQVKTNHPDCEFVNDYASEIKVKGKSFEVVLSSGEKVEGRSVVIATGSADKELGVKGEKEFIGKGVTYCATCDGPLFKGKEVVVVGGGNSAMVGVQELSPITSRVYLVHRRKEFKADEVEVERVKKLKNVKMFLDEELSEIFGGRLVEGVKLKSGKTLKVQGVFIEIGVKPLSDLALSAGAELDRGFIKVDNKQRTSIQGIFAAGDVSNKNPDFLQLTTSVSEGAIAGFQAASYVANLG